MVPKSPTIENNKVGFFFSFSQLKGPWMRNIPYNHKDTEYTTTQIIDFDKPQSQNVRRARDGFGR